MKKKEVLTLDDAMKYPNAEIRHENNFIVTIYPCLNNYLLSNPYNFQNWISDCKLILRNSYTEEEKKEIQLKFFKYITLNPDKWDSQSQWEIPDLLKDIKLYFVTATKLVNYMRFKNIDVDGYLQDGKAVLSS